MNTLAQLLRSEDGNSMVEWCLVVGLVSTATIACSTVFLNSIYSFFMAMVQRAANLWPA
jgi:Flp pilus assembly pilin Flp